MYGPIGSGKTSLVRRLQEKLSQDERYIVKLLISPNLKSSNAFLRLILETFDVKTERSYTASLSNFEKFLLYLNSIRNIKLFAANRDIKDYEVIELALTAFFEKNK